MQTAFDFGNVNWLALAVAVVANMVIGFVWYAPWFPTGKMWMRYMGLTADHKPAQGEMMKGMIMMLVGAFLMMLVLGHVIGKSVGGVKPDMELALGWGFLFWLGFQLPIVMGAVAWEKKAMGHGLINAGYQLVTMLLAALIFVLMA